MKTNIIKNTVLAGSLLLTVSAFSAGEAVPGIECTSGNKVASGGNSTGALIFQGNTNKTINVYCPLDHALNYTSLVSGQAAQAEISVTNKSSVNTIRCRIRVRTKLGTEVVTTGNTYSTLVNTPETIQLSLPVEAYSPDNISLIWCRAGARTVVHSFGTASAAPSE